MAFFHPKFGGPEDCTYRFLSGLAWDSCVTVPLMLSKSAALLASRQYKDWEFGGVKILG